MSTEKSSFELRFSVETVRENVDAGPTGPDDGYIAAAIAEVRTCAHFRRALDHLYSAFDDMCVDIFNRAQELASDDDQENSVRRFDHGY